MLFKDITSKLPQVYNVATRNKKKLGQKKQTTNRVDINLDIQMCPRQTLKNCPDLFLGGGIHVVSTKSTWWLCGHCPYGGSTITR